MPDCEICGARSEELFIMSVEGAKITVCGKCKPQGKVLGVIADVAYAPERISSAALSGQNTQMPRDREEPPEYVDDLASRIRNAREARKMPQEELAQKVAESVSLIRKIELGKAEPTEKAAHRIQKVLNIGVFKKKEDKPLEIKKSRKAGEAATLGDVVVVKSK